MIMKNEVRFWLLMLTSSLFLGCSNDDPTDNPTPSPESEKKELIFKIGDTTNMWPGDIREVDILTTGTYVVKAIDDLIAKVEPLGGSKFKVTAKAKGVTKTSIVDENNDTHTFPIWVSDKSPSGEWVDIAERFKINVLIENKDIKTIIESDLGNKRTHWVGATYNFDTSNNTFKTYGSVNYTGNYIFDIYSKKFELNYNGVKDMFSIVTDPSYGDILTLNEELTDYYKEQYPDGGVQEVTVSRTITRKRLEFE